jgi:hypothetical protein
MLLLSSGKKSEWSMEKSNTDIGRGTTSTRALKGLLGIRKKSREIKKICP